MQQHNATVPHAMLLAQWRDDMIAGVIAKPDGSPYAVKSINARLAAARKLLRLVARTATDPAIKLALKDWAEVEDAKATVIQDKMEEDYGRRLTLESLQNLVASIPTDNLKGIRDRAIIALAAGAGLRVSEISRVTLKDVFDTVDEQGQRGIHVRKGKHNKTRVVVINGWNSWVIQACQVYAEIIDAQPGDRLFRGVKRLKGGKYASQGTSLSVRQVQVAISSYPASYNGQMVTINPHDLRRTYAKICVRSGMTLEALRENMGHSSVIITENYVGHDVDWSDRVPNWSIKLD